MAGYGSARRVPLKSRVSELEITRCKRILSRDQDGGERHDHNGKCKDQTLDGFFSPQGIGR